jgi:putative membrane protein
MKFIYPILGIVLCVLLVGFIIKNMEPVELHYYLGFVWRTPLSLMLLITFLIGVVAGIAVCISSLIKQRRSLIALQRELKTLNPGIHA